MFLKFESILVKSLQTATEESGVRALVYKYPMTKYQMQGFDVYVDSPVSSWYRAYECKSLDFTEPAPLYFSSHFHVSKGVHQLDYESSILAKSGRSGYLAVELRRKKSSDRSVSLIPFDEVMRIRARGNKSLPVKYLISNQRMRYCRGLYVFDGTPENYPADEV